ncbi:MAG: diaminopimelate decarboxylase [Phycisphaerae bacterium]
MAFEDDALMDYFGYKDDKLFAENVPVEQIARQVATPVYIYSKATFLDHLDKIKKAYARLDTLVCYSVKACGNVNILRFMAQAGSGFDIVSGGELYRAKLAGADPSKIVFAGVGKTDSELTDALNTGIAYFNIESEAELENLIRIAAKLGKKAKAALRVNPDIEYKTHRFIRTGKKETKFGVDIERAQNVFTQYGSNENIKLCALHVHLGSGGKTIDPYVEAVKRTLPLVDTLRAKGHSVEALNLGGGYGADYESDTVPSAADYASGIVPLLENKNLKLILEPGKSISANAGILVARVLYLKQGGAKKFVIVDTAMNDLIRPCLYDAFHFIWPAQAEQKFIPPRRSQDLKIEGTETVDIVGPICEGADFLAKDRNIPPVKQGDLLAVFTAGAYGFTMSSNYNARPRAAEVLVDGDKFTVIRKRETYDDLVRLEK